MTTFSKQIHEKLKKLPDQPGVYLMRDRRGKVIYIGKAASLRSRVRHYFQSATLRKADPKLRGLIRSIEDFDVMPLRTEAEAAITESQFIKDYKPRYNILLKDDKRFPLLKVDVQHPFPVVTSCRLQKRDDALYFGPYTNSTAARAAKDFLERRFGLRQCAPLHPTPENYKHCINDIIRYCSAPCIGKIS
ncbi:MAG: GIY-YIG nuclease family protein, partial [Kiritimatiellae bacterium]|nr:GIY-YIG nuclease family protein [Kiritimatiellia bacterium]